MPWSAAPFGTDASKKKSFLLPSMKGALCLGSLIFPGQARVTPVFRNYNDFFIVVTKKKVPSKKNKEVEERRMESKKERCMGERTVG